MGWHLIIWLAFVAQPIRAEDPLEQAWRLELEGKYEEAARWYLRAYEETPGRQALYGLIRNGFRTGQYDVLVPVLEEYLQTHPEDGDVELRLGEALYRIGQVEKAVKVWGRLVRTALGTPAGRKALVRTAEVLSERRDYGKLISLLRASEPFPWRSPEGAKAAFLLGEAYVHMDSLKAAEDVYRRLIRRAPAYADSARFMLGEVCFWNGEIDEAKKAWQEVARNPSSPLADDAVRRLLWLEEGSQEALKAFALGTLRLRQGRLKEAIVSLSSPELSGSSLWGEAVLFIGEIHLQVGDTLKAISELKPLAFSQNPLAPEALFRLGEILQREEAAKVYEDFLERYPDDVRVEEVRRRLRELIP